MPGQLFNSAELSPVSKVRYGYLRNELERQRALLERCSQLEAKVSSLNKLFRALSEEELALSSTAGLCCSPDPLFAAVGRLRLPERTTLLQAVRSVPDTQAAEVPMLIRAAIGNRAYKKVVRELAPRAPTFLKKKEEKQIGEPVVDDNNGAISSEATYAEAFSILGKNQFAVLAAYFQAARMSLDELIPPGRVRTVRSFCKAVREIGSGNRQRGEQILWKTAGKLLRQTHLDEVDEVAAIAEGGELTAGVGTIKETSSGFLPIGKRLALDVSAIALGSRPYALYLYHHARKNGRAMRG